MSRTGILVSLVSALLVGCETRSGLRAADAPTAESQAAAKKVASEWYAALAAAATVEVVIETNVAVSQNDEVVQSDEAAYRLTVKRPNQLALATTKGNTLAVVADDKQVYVYYEPAGKYQRSDAPLAALTDLSEMKVLRLANFGIGLGLLGDALQAASFDAFWRTYESPAYVGVEEKNGVKAHHLRVVREEMPFDVWIDSTTPRLLAVAPDLAAGLAAEQGKLPPGVKYSIVTAYKNWSYDAALPADAFAIVPPSGAEQVDDILAPPPHKLLGQQAPAVDTTDLNGHPVKQADLAGKVVLLDFWATWCGPCIAALPKVNEVATKYKDKGVVFYAVNQGEETSIIKEFLAAQSLNVPVAMDVDGKLGGAFGVEGIPQTVIIDKNGKVQVVHVGAGPDIGDELKKDLDAVLAGKDLADEKLKKKSK